MWIFYWHDRTITFLSDGGISEADDDDESIIPSSTSAVQRRKRNVCVFCGMTKSDISRHMLSAPRHEQTIIDISLLKKSERIAALAQLRRNGISHSNVTVLACEGTSSDLVCEGKSEGEKVICPTCGGVFRKAFFYRHSKNCCQASVVSRPEPVTVPNVRGAEAVHDPQWPNLLPGMNRNAILEVLTANPTILRLGKRIFDATKEKASFRHPRKTTRIIHTGGCLQELFRLERQSCGSSGLYKLLCSWLWYYSRTLTNLVNQLNNLIATGSRKTQRQPARAAQNDTNKYYRCG